MNKGLTINFDCNFIININEVSLENILTAFKEFLPQILTQFIMNILLGYAEYIMQKKENGFTHSAEYLENAKGDMFTGLLIDCMARQPVRLKE